MSSRWRTARCRLSVVHPGGVLTNIVRNSRTGAGDHRQCAPRGIDRPLRCDREDHAAGRRAAHHRRHREEPAAHPDRQRRPLHGSAAAVSAGDVLGGAGEADREDGGERGSRFAVTGPLSAVVPANAGTHTPRRMRLQKVSDACAKPGGRGVAMTQSRSRWGPGSRPGRRGDCCERTAGFTQR